MSKPSQEAPRIGILTISDRATRGIYEDLSGPAIEKALREFLATECVYERRMVVDEIPEIVAAIRAFAEAGCALICTTGGTGPAPRDVTPEAMEEVCPKLLAGFGERMRQVAIARLNTLLHQPPDCPLPPPPARLRLAAALPEAPELRALALARRPDLAALTDRLAADQAALALAYKEFCPDFELMAEPVLSIVGFRYRPAGLDDEERLARLNRQIVNRLVGSGAFFLAPTLLKGRTAMRTAIVNFRTSEDDLRALLDEAAAAGKAILAG